jgi:hypothetical protein
MKDAAVVPTAEPVARSSGAERMRLYRERRRDGLMCFTVELRSSEIDELIRRGLLQHDRRDNRHDVTDAVHRFFDESLSGNPRALV